MTEQEKYADKIAALLRKAESTTPEEAELLFQKAQELMEKYAIDEAMLRAAGKEAVDDPITRKEFVVVGIYRYPIADMLYRLAQINGLKMVKTNSYPRVVGGKTYKQTEIRMVVGYQSDIERTELLFNSLQIQMVRAEATWWKTFGAERFSYLSGSKAHLERRQFMFSFGQGAHMKLLEATKRGREFAEAEYGSSGVEMVLLSKEQRVAAEFEAMYPSLTKSRSRYGGGSAGTAQQGHAAGRKADVGQPGLGGSRKVLGK